MTPANSSGDDGFSILEMIVAMTILALVLGIASQTIVLASRSIVTAREQVEAARKLRAIMAQYDAGNDGAAKLDGIAQSGWTLKTYPVDVAKAKMSAIVIEKGGAGGSGSFLTFLPVTQQNRQ
ncbi:prepilin-type N-terminal cleavage/methylation domain-containing protein [Mesorhizobium sp. B2-3-5]|uniref:PulJ/GspJ family protein n=1 Tax=Mesorhizobium sp. B2-3-5 TaxID=2589958 RepID=UPI00112A71F2|nr:prepilin-type N-terminal cleavage/methylation domain-containing protein [Mesorhizobium sp. B2-3-5]TPM16323.1 prepilin-type N-terminal cleavage/methylation domain-containing protein [Mesorhizobium sp. B2-3-5]